ncbi:uncharacterized protein LOC117114711 [Anneissia japonica]|uniref:uncharacterized protein LOC117114711 n=1 Tax=Anneissia japonica TaxID=1529436 RepID=UPI0014255490|nr:uncharacterized protein LOC117114711 [Anneissia japonica]
MNTQEVNVICSRECDWSSVLRKTSKEDLANFRWEMLQQELQDKASHLLQFMMAAVSNPRQKYNIRKTSEHIMPAVLDATAKLLSLYNDNMNAIRKIKGIILKKAGLKKTGFMRLAALYDTITYPSINRTLEAFGEHFQQPLLGWKRSEEVAYEQEKAGSPIEESLQDVPSKEESKMPPGYSFTGNSIIIRTFKNINKINLLTCLTFKKVVYNLKLSEIENYIA